MANNVSVKAYLIPEDFHGKDEIRRFTLDGNINSNFLYLREKLVILFPVLQRRPFSILYKDEEGDLITMSSDDELKTACLASIKDNLLRINIKRDRNGGHHGDRKFGSYRIVETTNNVEHENLVHPRVTCDGCEGPVIGFRYKCVQCPDYDLCMGCEIKQIHPQHVMMRIPSPDSTYLTHGPGMHEKHGSRARRFGHAGHRRRHGGKTCGGKAEGEVSDDGPSDQDKFPYPFQFNQVLEKIWTTLGGLPRESSTLDNTINEKKSNVEKANDEYLHKVGNTVAAMLDPLGIDVDVRVTKNNVSQTGANQNTPSVEKEVPKESFSTAATAVLRNPEEFKTIESSKNDIAKLSEKSSENMIYPSLAQEIAKQEEKSAETNDGWMYVDVEAKEAALQQVPVEEVKSPKLSGGPPLTSIANEMSNLSLGRTKPPPHSNPAICSALDQMISMGFSNEGGWLTQLLEVKNGNIDDVLEVLTPHSKSN